jgi:hypothetical protein
VPSSPYLRWARRSAAGTPASKLCSPRESVRDDPCLGQAGTVRRCSPGVLSLQSSLHHGSGFGVSQGLTWGAKPRATYVLGRPAVAVACRDPDSDAWAREPRIRRRAGSIEPRASPSGSDPAHARFRDASCASRQRRSTPSRTCSSDASCPCPLSAAPRAFLPFTVVSLVGGVRPLDLEDALVEPLTRPHPLRGRLAATLLTEQRPGRSFAGLRQLLSRPRTR